MGGYFDWIGSFRDPISVGLGHFGPPDCGLGGGTPPLRNWGGDKNVKKTGRFHVFFCQKRVFARYDPVFNRFWGVPGHDFGGSNQSIPTQGALFLRLRGGAPPQKGVRIGQKTRFSIEKHVFYRFSQPIAIEAGTYGGRLKSAIKVTFLSLLTLSLPAKHVGLNRIGSPNRGHAPMSAIGSN